MIFVLLVVCCPKHKFDEEHLFPYLRTLLKFPLITGQIGRVEILDAPDLYSCTGVMQQTISLA